VEFSVNQRGRNRAARAARAQQSGSPAQKGGGQRKNRRGGRSGGQNRQKGYQHRQQRGQQGKAPSMQDATLGEVSGVLELVGGGGYLRDHKKNLAARPTDPPVPKAVVEQYALRGGELLEGLIVAAEGVSGNKTLDVQRINGVPVAEWTAPSPLEETTAIDPQIPLKFSTPGGPLSMRILELFTPIGLGQRGLIVAPPRTGKTVLLQQIAHGIAVNHPDIYMIVLLVDERPEEVTEMRRNVHGEVFASSNDHDAPAHVRLARLVVERARRLVECGQHIVILLDSITRLARAFNHVVGSSGRTLSGGLDINALQEPKQIFGAARAVEHGGSLTILGTALVETGSRGDEFIFQEFKGTGNMELKLDRELSNLRIWPAIDLGQSGTRKEEKLLAESALLKVNMIRRQLHGDPPARAMEALIGRMERYDTTEGFLESLRG
jgi:transcription termination factor Rho